MGAASNRGRLTFRSRFGCKSPSEVPTTPPTACVAPIKSLRLGSRPMKALGSRLLRKKRGFGPSEAAPAFLPICPTMPAGLVEPVEPGCGWGVSVTPSERSPNNWASADCVSPNSKTVHSGRAKLKNLRRPVIAGCLFRGQWGTTVKP